MEKKQSILIVEDDPVSMKLLARSLDRYTLYRAADGVEGYDTFVAHHPDIVVTDLNMPNRDGLTLFKMIRKVSPTTPVIILSGVGSKSDIVEMLRLGAINYLEKPIIDKEIVIHAVQKAFEMLHLEKANIAYQQNLELMVAEKTAELRAELQARDHAEKELLKAQKEWERTFDAIPDRIAIVDKNFTIQRANRAMAKLMNDDETLIHGCLCFKASHNAEQPHEKCPHALVMKDGEKHTVELYEERMGGNVEVTAIPYYDDDGTTLLGSVHIVRDINERKMMEVEREKMQIERLHTQKLESVGQLAAGIAHEINTPVQFVSTNNDFLEESFGQVNELMSAYDRLFSAARNGSVTPDLIQDVELHRDEADWEYLEKEIPQALKQSHEGLSRVASIVRAMKEFSHPGSRDKESRNLNDILETTGVVARNEWKYVAQLEMRLDENLPSVMCYSDDIGQVILNVIINAAHAIEDKLGRNPTGEKGRITITSATVGSFVEIRISDTGSGMSQEVAAKIFDPFFTTKKLGRGTGQGLSIAWNIITEKHNGELKVESDLGVGTTFIIRIPFDTMTDPG